MADYDLVVIGRTPAGIHAAIAAAHLKARVALVGQPILDPSTVSAGVLAQLGRLTRQLWQAEQMGLWTLPPGQTSWRHPHLWQQASQRTQSLTACLETMQTEAVLTSLGIDLIPEQGEFCRKPVPGFTLGGRHLRSRAYLLAVPCRPQMPEIEGLQATGYLTPETLLQDPARLEGLQDLIVIGNTPTAVELAQALNRLEIQVTLVVDTTNLLPQADPEATYLLQALLEAEGVRILTDTRVTQVRQIEAKKWVQAGNQAIAADEILLAMTPVPQVTALNLEAMQVPQTETGIAVNPRLQTRDRRIYACNLPIHGIHADHLGIYQATVAVKNALFFPLLRVDYAGIPQMVNTDPPLAGVGMTETAAIARYGTQVEIVRQPFKTLPLARIQASETGFCKLICHRNGRLLGAHLVGSQSGELIAPLTLALHRRLKRSALTTLALPDSSFASIVAQTAIAGDRQRFHRSPRLQTLLQEFFDGRRG